MNLPARQSARIEEFPAFDAGAFDVLRELQGEGEEAMLAEIAGQFIEDLEGLLGRIRAAIAANDFKAAVSAAHTVKGSAATFGLSLTSELARHLELAAKAEDRASLDAWMDRIANAFSDGKNALRAELEKNQP